MSGTMPDWLAERLRKEGQKTVAYFSSLTDEQWRNEVYTEGDTWTIRSVLAHFVTSERGLLRTLSPRSAVCSSCLKIFSQVGWAHQTIFP